MVDFRPFLMVLFRLFGLSRGDI